MSWAEGRTKAPTPGQINEHDQRRKDALDRVHHLMCALGQDRLLQEDLRHPDVRKALDHWTGRNRLSEDDADELMEDNFRVKSVCDKMAELQSLCRHANIGLPLAHVLAGKGLFETLDETELRKAHPLTTTTNSGMRGSIANNAAQQQAASSSPGGAGHQQREDVVRNRKGAANTSGSSESFAKTPIGGAGAGTAAAAAAAAAAAGNNEELSWWQALMEEMVKVTAVGVCALLFTLLLKYCRGDDPLGNGLPGREASSSRTDEL